MKAVKKAKPAPSSAPRSARAVALDVLRVIEGAGLFADDALEHHAGLAALSDRDRALALELSYGVLRHRAELDWRLAKVSDRPIPRLPSAVANILRVGAYQILHLERVPTWAAVSESVSLAKEGGATARWAGFVNAVLRALLRAPAPPWPDAATDPFEALMIRYSCPPWLAQRWIERVGIEDAEALCRRMADIPPLTIRVNALRSSRDDVARALAEKDIQSEPTPVSPAGLKLNKGRRVTTLPIFAEGAFYIEDEAAQLIPPILDPQPGERVLDACAAPGGKATHLAALMRNAGEIIATDRSPERLRLVEENCRRLGVTIITPVTMDLLQTGHPALSRPFDRILLDAPCSGMGVLRRHPEAKWQKHEGLLARHQTTQLALLERVAALLRPGGVLVYSTCSTEPEENELVVDRFCRQHADFARESIGSWLPPAGRHLLNPHGDFSTVRLPDAHMDMDGFFAARLRKAV